MNNYFHRFAAIVAAIVGSPWSFIAALLIITAWILTGPIFKFSDTWQLVINTGTTIITFLIVFLIQNTQNRDSRAIHLKLDELLKGVEGSRTEFVNLEEMSDEEIEKYHDEFKKLHEHYELELQRRKADLTKTPR